MGATKKTNDQGQRVVQHITVFQQNGSGERKIAGVRSHAGDSITIEVVSIDGELPPVIDDTSPYLPERLQTDLVLDFLTHRDLSEDLVKLCARLVIPVISSGKKSTNSWGHKPPT